MPCLIHLLWVGVWIASGTLLPVSRKKGCCKNGTTIAKLSYFYNSLCAAMEHGLHSQSPWGYMRFLAEIFWNSDLQTIVALWICCWHTRFFGKAPLRKQYFPRRCNVIKYCFCLIDDKLRKGPFLTQTDKETTQHHYRALSITLTIACYATRMHQMSLYSESSQRLHHMNHI